MVGEINTTNARIDMLTTITPYWNRPEQLKIWLQALRGAGNVNVQHLLIVRGTEEIPPDIMDVTNLRICKYQEGGNESIGHFHNIGAELADTEWIMKLDVDCLPHLHYFSSLIPILIAAKRREWFNGGMLYVNEQFSKMHLREDQRLDQATYNHIMSSRVSASASSYRHPAASNFICRRQDYLDLGGCPSEFKGYGWEDYAQLYMLERYQKQAEPLPGPVTLHNVTQRCRDEISRRKALELWHRDNNLCLLHRWHSGCTDVGYKTEQHNNRHVLWRYITVKRQEPIPG